MPCAQVFTCMVDTLIVVCCTVVSDKDPRTLPVTQGVKTFSSHTDWVTSIAWSAHSEYQVLTSSHDKSAKLWDTRTSVPLHTLEGHTDKVCLFQPFSTYNTGHSLGSAD